MSPSYEKMLSQIKQAVLCRRKSKVRFADEAGPSIAPFEPVTPSTPGTDTTNVTNTPPVMNFPRIHSTSRFQISFRVLSRPAGHQKMLNLNRRGTASILGTRNAAAKLVQPLTTTGQSCMWKLPVFVWTIESSFQFHQ